MMYLAWIIGAFVAVLMGLLAVSFIDRYENRADE